MVELIWDGKYDKDGNKRAPVRVALPFQTVETVNESAQDRQRSLELFGAGREPEWRNRLIWGDKKYVLPSLLPEFAGKVDLIYIDPPFDTGADFSFTATLPGSPDHPENGLAFGKQPSVLEQKAYRDTWSTSAGRFDSYLQWFYETALLLRELMCDSGNLLTHIGVGVSNLVRTVLAEVLGADRLQAEIVWQRHDPHNDALRRPGCITDRVLWFGASPEPYYAPDARRDTLSASAEAEFSLLELTNGSVVPYKGNEHMSGRRFKLDDATWKGTNAARRFEWRGAKPSDKREWMYELEGMEAALGRGELYLRDATRGAARCRKRYLDENKGILPQDLWTNLGRMKGGSAYPTQKPEGLLEQIVEIACPEGGLVLDCFAGSGTTAVVSERLSRPQQRLAGAYLFKFPNENEAFDGRLLRGMVFKRPAARELVVGFEPVIQENSSGLRDSLVSACSPSLDRLAQGGHTGSRAQIGRNVQKLALRFASSRLWPSRHSAHLPSIGPGPGRPGHPTLFPVGAL